MDDDFEATWPKIGDKLFEEVRHGATAAHDAGEREYRLIRGYQRVDIGFYIRETMEVRQKHRSTPALVYIATDSRSGRPRRHYLETIIGAAKDLGLPDSYVEELRQRLLVG